MADDVLVTFDAPLKITKASDPVTFGTITIQDGGYIVITVPVTFSCENLIKYTTTSGQSLEYDIFIQPPKNGDNGLDAVPAVAANGAPDPAASGISKKCSAANFAHYCRGGDAGNPGYDGADGGHGENGDKGPSVILNLGVVSGSIGIRNAGGNGGHGGNGGIGGKGANGGKGGDGGTCGSLHSSGCNGGNGGNGGKGGAAGSGGNGGNPGTCIVTYTPKDSTSGVIGISCGGEKGLAAPRAAGGDGGEGGAGGSHGGHNGSKGAHGDPGSAGYDGIPGTATPSLIINGEAF